MSNLISPKANFKKLYIKFQTCSLPTIMLLCIASSRLLWTDTYLVEYMYYVISGVCLWSWKWCLTSLATPCHCWWLTHMSIRSLWKNLHLSGTRRTSLTNSPTENIKTHSTQIIGKAEALTSCSWYNANRKHLTLTNKTELQIRDSK